MSRLAGSLVALTMTAALSLPGCAKKTATSGSTGSTGSTGSAGNPAAGLLASPNKQCRPTRYMKIPVLKPATEAETHCAKDADCVVTTLMEGNCCDRGCNSRGIYTRAFHDRLRKHQQGCCKGITLSCKRWRCQPPELKITTTCQNRQCVEVRTPIK